MNGVSEKRAAVGWGLFLVAMVAVFLLGLLAASITERRAEIAGSVFSNKKVDIKGIEPRNQIWGENYPREYNTWRKTSETDYRSKHLGNAPEDVLESRPNMVVLWAGYAFSRDYNAPRGHMYTLDDMRATLRVGAPGVPGGKDLQPGTCWTCKSPDVPRLMKEKGLDNYYKAKWSEWGAEVVNPLGCADCHDPETMSLTITRPALIEAFERQGKDVQKSSPQEMRTLVCAQCHVEYYFKGAEKHLTFPWDKGSVEIKHGVMPGITVEQMEQYYDEIDFKDWTHALSKAPMLKAQHPGFEVWMLGTHGQRGVACADCHMPYISEGGVKYTNHQIMSPLKHVETSCQVCHRENEADLKNYVYERQDKALEVRDRVEAELAKAHIMTKAALDAGWAVDSPEIKAVHKLLRAAGWRWDFAVASHGGSFHAPVETMRILSAALDKSLQAQIEVQKLLTAKGVMNVPMPDLSTKAKAQAYIGLDMDKLKAEKAEFMKTVVPAWLKAAEAAGRLKPY